MQDFRNLEIYHESEALTMDIYELTSHFPDVERYNMTQHIRKTVLSIGANIAEGAAKQSDRDFSKFLFISMGSLKELEHFFNIAHKLSYISSKEFESVLLKTNLLGKKINCLLNKTRRCQ